MGLKDPRALFGAITHPDDGRLDDLLIKAPQAAKDLIDNNNPEAAKKLINGLNFRVGGLTQRRNYGYGVEGHHPLSISGSYLLGADMPMGQAQEMYDILRLNGLNVGTMVEEMLPITRIAHDIAHIDPITHKTNKRGFQPEMARFRQADPEARAMAYTPLGLLEQGLSNLAYNRLEEQKVRRFAAEIVGITPEQLVSLERNPNYVTPQGRQGKLSYANSALQKLGLPEMKAAILAGYGNKNMEDIISPNQYKFEYKRGNKPPEYRDRKAETGNPVKDALSMQRPGSYEPVRRLIR